MSVDLLGASVLRHQAGGSQVRAGEQLGMPAVVNVINLGLMKVPTSMTSCVSDVSRMVTPIAKRWAYSW